MRGYRIEGQLLIEMRLDKIRCIFQQLEKIMLQISLFRNSCPFFRARPYYNDCINGLELAIDRNCAVGTEEDMDDLQQAALRERFQGAIDAFVEKIEDDLNVIAVLVAGSFAYDVLWEKSDIDMMIIVRDQKLTSTTVSLVEDGLTINAGLIPRSAFKRGMEGSIGGSFFQSFISNGKIVFTRDESLYEYLEELRHIGDDDKALTALILVFFLLDNQHKAMKYLTARRDVSYAQYFLLKCAETVAAMELCVRGIPTSRTAIQKALAFNPEIMQLFYLDLLRRQLTEEELFARIRRLDQYIEEHMPLFQRPVLEYLADGEIKTVSMISRHVHAEGPITSVLDFLAERGVIEKVSQQIKLTAKSRMAVEEIGYQYVAA